VNQGPITCISRNSFLLLSLNSEAHRHGRISVTFVISHSISTSISLRTNAYIAVSGHLAVKCVISHLFRRVTWGAPTHTQSGAAICLWCVISRTVKSVIWRCINAYIAMSGHLAVMYVISHSFSAVIWTLINANILRNGHIFVTCVIGHSTTSVV
jgi:hypothetical protein